MKQLISCLMLGLLLYACGTQKGVQKWTGPGSSFENAIFMKETTESKGVPAEYTWLSEHYPKYKMLGQSLVYNNNKPYDILKIKTNEGNIRNIYFDISNFFGKN